VLPQTLPCYEPTFSFLRSARKGCSRESASCWARDLLEQVGEHTNSAWAPPPIASPASHNEPSKSSSELSYVDCRWLHPQGNSEDILSRDARGDAAAARAGEQGTPRRLGIVAGGSSKTSSPPAVTMARTRESLAVHRLSFEDREGGAKIV
jgi:hypothetical protein